MWLRTEAVTLDISEIKFLAGDFENILDGIKPWIGTSL